MALNPHTSPAGDDAPRATFRSLGESVAEDWDIIVSQVHHTQNMTAGRVIRLLRDLESDHGGFPVNRLEHSLQTASRAERDGRDDEYVFCALIHDIGDTLSPHNHPEVAAAIIKPYVSDANHFMVLNHNAFQGYYYWQHLDRDVNTRDMFRDSPHFDQTAEFCALYDQIAFDPSYTSNPLKHYEPLVRQFLTVPDPAAVVEHAQ